MLTIDTFRNEPNVVGVGVGAGEVIFRDGEAGSEMFAIVEGTVDIHKNGKCITSLQALEVFGEMAPIDGKPRSAMAVARRASYCWFDGRRFSPCS